ncbi:glycerophosphodiester phosphodiesterase [Actinoplanes derwentensis]|uniref:Glycerophosphoryl diester phosphodiesterase n=1 Tax=Actinoplanes derwentensis TaxID=113562 RepID=A0A1H2D5E2_9ACTN|nr:glycerophosphodiester phosphodiesterase family protein [Actinoplanes derwentensis]GID85310.1 glycerophosphodiester phosphodiesterase [Actinoplanes derwentensis]SDT77960.1 glycerophosphoryl diester phosphodiesterase [Actinoplanes derwentensis]
MTHVVAHRGYPTVAPENTLPAFAAALRAGATIVEFDVRCTRDGVPVVIHDRTVDRTTDGSGRVWDLTAAEIARLDAGSWFGPGFTGLRVPTLVETLDLLAPATAELLVEIKPPATLDEVKSIIAQLGERDLLDRSVVQSFDADVLRKVRDVAPEVRRGLLLFRFDGETVEIARELGVTYCNPPVDDVLNGPETMAALTAAGVGVMPWTPNDMARWRPLVDAGAAGLITDLVGELTGWVNA